MLDRVLADAAADVGARIVHDAIADDMVRDASGRVCGVHITDPTGATQRVEAQIVIGADGARSGIARAVNAGVLRSGSTGAR